MTFGRKKFLHPTGPHLTPSKMKKNNNKLKTTNGKPRKFKSKPRKVSIQPTISRPLEPNYEKPGYKRPQSLLPLLEHQDKCVSCTRCNISGLTTQKVIYRGSFPPEILFIGEAPGISEDSTGLPFVGLSGQLLNDLLLETGIPHSAVGFTNSILCTPYTSTSRDEIREPSKEEVANCSGNLVNLIDTIRSSSPTILTIITLGKIAESQLKKLKLDYYAIPHPSVMLRSGGSESLMYARSVIELKDIWINHERKKVAHLAKVLGSSPETIPVKKTRKRSK